MCEAELLCCPPETITTLLIGFTALKNKKLKKNKNVFSGSVGLEQLQTEPPILGKSTAFAQGMETLCLSSSPT